MKSRCYAYIRTSTVRQGTEGVSLEAQRDAISMYAKRLDIDVVEWFTEMQTAAKRGRPVFSKMMRGLTKKKVDGLILHRIDRGSRNLKDWSSIADLTDLGLQVHFAHDSLDLATRGGRLAADVQAVVAADFIRNLQWETRKGMLGRLKQGYYPFKAPLGYLDNGRAKAKTICPVKGPLVRKAFELYSTGKYSFNTLSETLFDIGLRSTQGKPLSDSSLTSIFNNQFYMGLMRLPSTDELFNGLHKSLVTPELYARVQDVLHGKVSHRGLKHNHLYRRGIVCKSCGYKLIGELQKGRVYYRCHTRICPTTSLREDVVTDAMRKDAITLIDFFIANPSLAIYLRNAIAAKELSAEETAMVLVKNRGLVNDRLAKLLDAVVDGVVSKEDYVDRKNTLMAERRAIDDRIALYQAGKSEEVETLRRYLELMETLRDKAILENAQESHQILKSVTSNFIASGKTVVLQWNFPYDRVLDNLKESDGDPSADTHRTLMRVYKLFTTQHNTEQKHCNKCKFPSFDIV